MSTALKNALKADGRTRYINTVEDTPWIGTSYWICQVGDTARKLLAKYNLDVAPTRLDVNGTITALDGEPPAIDQIVALPEVAEEIARYTISGNPAIISANGTDCVVYTRSDGTHVFLNRQYHDVIDAEIGGIAEIRQEAANKPAHLIGPKGRGLLMPMRA